MRSLSLSEAVVVHVTPWSETSAIVQCLTQQHGRIAAMSRGGRKKYRGYLSPGQQAQVALTGNGSLKTLATFEPVTGPSYHPRAWTGVLYACSIIVNILPEADPAPRVLSALVKLLNTAHQGPVAARELLALEQEAAEFMGFGLDAATISPGSRYRFLPLEGLIEGQTGVRGEHISKVLQGIADAPGVAVDEMRSLYQVILKHTARRDFATLKP